jgi:DNA polymerase III delta prime subunit
VLALTGQTGVGKTETAWVLAEALLTKRTNYAGGTHLIPKGLVVFRGEVDRLAD